MKLSPAQRRSLVWMLPFDGSQCCKLVGRGLHYENQLVHDALVRRGLITEDAGGFTVFTDSGRNLAKKIGSESKEEARKRLPESRRFVLREVRK